MANCVERGGRDSRENIIHLLPFYKQNCTLNFVHIESSECSHIFTDDISSYMMMIVVSISLSTASSHWVVSRASGLTFLWAESL